MWLTISFRNCYDIFHLAFWLVKMGLDLNRVDVGFGSIDLMLR